MLPFVDVTFVIFLSGFLFYGFYAGLIRAFGSLVAMAAGVWMASRFHLPAYDYVKDFFLGYDGFGKIFLFIIIYSLVNRVVLVGFGVIEKAFNLISIIPFLKTINRILGGIFSLAQGVLILTFFVYLLSVYTSLPLIGSFFAKLLITSRLSPYLIKIAYILKPLWPGIIVKIKSFV